VLRAPIYACLENSPWLDCSIRPPCCAAPIYACLENSHVKVSCHLDKNQAPYSVPACHLGFLMAASVRAGGPGSRKGEVVDFLCEEFGFKLLSVDRVLHNQAQRSLLGSLGVDTARGGGLSADVATQEESCPPSATPTFHEIQRHIEDNMLETGLVGTAITRTMRPYPLVRMSVSTVQMSTWNLPQTSNLRPFLQPTATTARAR